MKCVIRMSVLFFLVCIGIAAGFTSLSFAAPCKNVMYVQCSGSGDNVVTTIQEAVWKICPNGMIYVDSCESGYDGFAITNTYGVTIQAYNGSHPVISGIGYSFATGRTAGAYIGGIAHDVTIRGITITSRSGESNRSGFVIQDVTNTTLTLNNIDVSSNVECVSSTLSNTASLLIIRDSTGTYNVRKNWWGASTGPAWHPITLTYSSYKDIPYLAAAYSGSITKTVNTSNQTIPGIIDAITLTNITSAVLASFNEAPKVCTDITPKKYFDVLDVTLGTSSPQQITLTIRDANAIMYYDVTATGWKPARPITPTDSWVILELSNASEPSLSQLRSGVTGTFFVAGVSSGSGSSTTTSSSASSTTTSSATTTTTSISPASTTTSVPPPGGGGGTGESTVPVLQTTGYIGFVFPADDTVHTIQTQSFSITNSGGGTLEWSIGEPSYTGGSGWIIAISPQAGTNSGIVQVTVDRSRAPQAAGRYEATIPITSNGGSDNVLVRLTVHESGGGGGEPPAGAARLTVSPQSVAFDPSKTEQVVTAQNTGDAAGSWELSVRYGAKANNWLTVNPLSIALDPNESEQIALLVNRNGLAPDTYSASVDFIAETDNDTTAATIDVQMEVAALPELKPVLAVDKTVFFAGSGINSISISISNTGTGTLTWSTGNIQYRGLASGWLSINPQSGSLGQGQRATITATIDRNAVRLFGIYSATFSITSNGGNRNITILMWKPLFRR